MAETKPPSASSGHTDKTTVRKAAVKRAVVKNPAVKHPAAENRPAARPRTLFFDRDESWMLFNRRVLEEAKDPANPLLERVAFLAITASNLDEFVEIRMAGLLQRIDDGFDRPKRRGDGGLTPTQRLRRLNLALHSFVVEQYRCWNRELRPALAAQNIRILEWSELSEAARDHALAFYQAEVDPLLTPVTIDPSNPFPRVLNKALCIAFLLRSKRGAKGTPGLLDSSTVLGSGAALGVVTVPRALPRLVPLSGHPGHFDFIPLQHLIASQGERLFRGYRVLSRQAFRVTRNSNLYLQEEESRSLLENVRAELYNRRKGDAVRLEIGSAATPEMVKRLRANFELAPWQVFHADGPVNLAHLRHLPGQIDRPEIKFPGFSGRRHRFAPGAFNLFDELRQRDILLHHPFDSYATVERFIQSAAADPAVVSMQQTLYRTSAGSPLFKSLTAAAQSKEVSVVVELKASFDEASNIGWARQMKDAGVNVFLGLPGLKTHCKLALIVRRDADGTLRRYAHLGTGNYNSVTARFYTDISLLTARPEITSAVQSVFRSLTVRSDPAACAPAARASAACAPLLVAPLTLAPAILRLIAREAAHAVAGRPASIVAKMNALLDPATIMALYAASNAGVQIDLIVRGMCTLRPGVPGLSRNIRVRSIVGRFLEHSRIFRFANAGRPETFCGSADWMPRNLFERSEVLFPIDDPALAARVNDEILAAYLADNCKARLLQPNGRYRRAPQTAPAFNAQDRLMHLAATNDSG